MLGSDGTFGSLTVVRNANGAMTARDGDGLTYDAQQRLTKYAASEEYVYSTTNQRLIRRAGGTRTLYLPGMEVSVTGATRTIDCYLTIGATQVGAKTVVSGGATSFMWACGNMRNSNVCQVTAGSGAIPSRKRYAPYGASRQTTPVTFPNTDRGFLNQPHDTNGADVIAVLSLMPSGFAPWIYGGQDKLLLEHDRMMADAGLQAGMAIRLLRDSGFGAPDYLVIDVGLLVGPGLAIGGGGLFIYSRSGQIFNGGQLHVGSAGLTIGLRAGWLRTDERATAEEVDAFLGGPAVSASVSVVASATDFANFSGSSWEVGLSSSVGINLSLAWVAESAVKTSGWDV